MLQRTIIGLFAQTLHQRRHYVPFERSDASHGYSHELGSHNVHDLNFLVAIVNLEWILGAVASCIVIHVACI
jgi:hypothetical protein